MMKEILTRVKTSPLKSLDDKTKLPNGVEISDGVEAPVSSPYTIRQRRRLERDRADVKSSSGCFERY
jgi:hypothetical protein